MRAKGMKLSSTHLLWFYCVFLALFLSGIFWIGLEYLMHCESEGCNPFLQSILLKIHGATAMLALIIFGTLIPIHIQRGWSAKMNRGNGSFMIVLSALLTVTGYGLYYAGSENIRFLSHWIHIGLGVLFPLFLTWHIFAGRKSREKLKKINPL